MSDMQPDTPSQTPRRRRRWPRRVGIGVGVLVLLIAAALAWLLGTTSGLRFALGQARNLTGKALSVRQADGRLAGTIDLHGVRYAADGTAVGIDRLQARADLWSLLDGRVHLRRLSVDRIDVRLPASPANTRPRASSSSGFSLRAPVAMQVDKGEIGAVKVVRGDRTVFVSNHLALGATWTARRLAIDHLALQAPDGEVHLAGTLHLRPRYRGRARGRFRWRLDGTTYAGTLDADSNGRRARLDLALSQPAQAQVTARIQQRKGYPWQATLTAPGFDPRPWLGTDHLQQVAMDLHVNGHALAARVEGTLELNQHPLQIAPLVVQWHHAQQRLVIRRLHLSAPQMRGTLDGSGELALGGPVPQMNVELRWSDVRIPADLIGRTLDTQGQLGMHGSLQQFAAHARLKLGPPGQLADMRVLLQGSSAHIALQRLEVTQGKGSLTAAGRLDLKPALAWNVHAESSRFDPGALLPGWNGALDMNLDTHGNLTRGKPQGHIELHHLDGTLRHRPVSGQGSLDLRPDEVVDGRLALRSGSSHVTIRADASGKRNDIVAQLAVQSLGDWLPDASGRLQGSVRLRGAWPTLALDADLQGRALGYRKIRVATAVLKAHMPDMTKPAGRLSLHAESVDTGSLSFSRVRLDGSGDTAHHELKLQATGDPLSLQLALQGSQSRKAGWQGTLTTLDLGIQGMPSWRLQKPARLAWNRGTGSLSPLCLSPGKPLLCLQAKTGRDGSLDASYRLRQLPTQMVLELAGSDLPLHDDGTLEGQGHMQRSAKGVLTGQATLQARKGRITYVDQPGRPLLDYSKLQADVTLQPQDWHLRAGADLDHGGRFDAKADLTGPNHQQISGQMGLNVNSLAFVELFTDQVAKVQGKATARVGVTGTLDHPTVSGTMDLTGLAAEVPMAGLKLHDGRAHLATDNAGQLKLDAQIASGKGTVHLDGATGLEPGAATDLKITGKNVLVADIPAARVVVSPDLDVKQKAKLLAVTGKVTVDSANVDLTKLPGAGAAQPSPDVVVVDAKQEKKQQGLPITADVLADLGSHTQMKGYGLDGHLSGQVRVRERPGHATTGQGQVIVNGTYTAYGQHLHIKDGKLLFADTPIDNPGLDLRATRSLNPNATVNQGQDVGLQITGTARNPQATVFSNPMMSQSDALSYLVTGKPLSEVRGGQGNMVGAAAQALGSAAGDLLAKSVGSQIGLSDIGVSSNEALGGSSAFTVGKYLSPRLYLSYGVGLFEPGQVITLRYRISHRWNFEAQNASTFNRASFNYRYEK